MGGAVGLDLAQLQRICRDLAWSELASFAHLRSAIGSRLSAQTVRWDADRLDVDSLHRMQLATAAATWCDAYDSGFSDLFLARRNSCDWAQVMQRSRQASSGPSCVTFSSSGSTGERKHIRHREDFLRQEAADWALELPHIKRVVTLVATHHIYGFIWGVLLPQALNVPVLEAELDALPQAQAGDLWVAVPDQWLWLAQSKKPWPAEVTGVSSTAPLSADTHQGVLRHGLARLLQIYGSTETAGLAWRDKPEQPYALAAGRQRDADEGIRLQLTPGQWVQAPVQDQLEWVDDQRFHLRGRSDHSVQVAGHNVSPAWVAEQLMQHPAVSQASVRLDSQREPARLKAFVVLKAALGATADLERQVQAHSEQNLPWYAALASITFGDQLPRNAMGKLCDWPAA